MALYQRQVAQGGEGGAMSGGLFSEKARAGLMEYQAFRRAHPHLSRAELSIEWSNHKARMGAGAAVSGGRRMPKGVRHCMQEVLEPSGVRRCAQYMAGPGMGSALVGGRRMPKGVRHCAPGAEVMGPSGRRRCSSFAPGPAGSALVGGMFSSQSRSGLHEYQLFRKAHPHLSRGELSALWADHKARMMGSALVGGRKKKY